MLHGIGGVGKSTLAAEVLRSLGEDAGLVVSRAGPVSVDDVLGEIGARLHQAASAAEGGEGLARAALYAAGRRRGVGRPVAAAGRADPARGADDRAAGQLRGQPDTKHDGGGWQVRDPELAAFLAGWARRPGQGRLLFTCRYPFTLPGSAGRRLAGLHLGPLSAAETRKLMWRLPGLDALTAEEKNRAYRDVGGHPRTLEYLDALLRGGQARFDDVAERMEDRLRDRGIADPAAWLARPGRDLDASLAEAVTLSVDDVVLSGLLDRLAATPLATELVTGAAVYRVPVDDTALVFQVGQPAERPPDPERAGPHRPRPAGHPGSRRTRRRRPDLAGRRRADRGGVRPLPGRRGRGAAAAGRRAGWPGRRGGRGPGRRAAGPGTAPGTRTRCISCTGGRPGPSPRCTPTPPARPTGGRRRSGAGGSTPSRRAASKTSTSCWRPATTTTPPGRHDEALAAHEEAVNQLQTWGQYGRAAELCRETLTWLTPGSRDAAATEGTLGILAQLRGDYDTAEPLYRQALEIFERLGDQADMASSYHQLGSLAQLRGDYDAAEPLYRRSLEINERIGDQAGMASSYHQLGILAQAGGTTTPPSPCTAGPWTSSSASATRPAWPAATTSSASWPSCGGTTTPPSPCTAGPWRSSSGIGDQAGMASSYHQLGILAQDRGDYDTAEPLYRRSLDINERIGDQAGMASSYHQLGILAQRPGGLRHRRAPVPPLPGDQRAHRRPGRHGHQLQRPGRLERGTREPGRGGRLPGECPRHPAQDRHSGRRPQISRRSPGCATGSATTVSGPPPWHPGWMRNRPATSWRCSTNMGTPPRSDLPIPESISTDIDHDELRDQ